ncbi:MAG: PD-(D/E)XK nuclease family protein [Gemmatimonadales bacterium]|nr:MAG: PD-(D/E)XK nuclease family protein [Gemmatimonadales bacterium]
MTDPAADLTADLATDSAPLPTRHFLGWERPALPAAAAWLADRYASAGVLDLSELRVVLPGTRARRRLLELLLDEAESRGLPLLPPDLVTAGALPERLHTPVLPAPHPEVEEAAWRLALKGLGPESLARLLPAPPSDGDAGPWSSLATTVAGLHAQVGSEGLTFDDVAARCRGDLLYNDEERWKVLAEAQRRFRRSLHDAGLRDREGARLDALEAGLSLPPRPAGSSEPTLVLVGVVDLPGVVRRFLGAWPGRVLALVHAPVEFADRFDALGAVNPEQWDAAHLRIPDQNLRVVTRPDEQAGAVVRHVRGLGGSRSAEEITVGVPDPEVVPHVVGALEGVGVPARYAGGRPMHRTAPYRLLEALARFLDGRSYDALAELVRHPDLSAALRRHGVRADDPPTAVTDDYHALHLPAVLGTRMPGGPESGERAGSGPGPGAAYRRGAPSSALFRLRGALESLLGGADGQRRSLAAWADPFRGLLLALYPGEFDRNRPSDRDLLAFAGAAERALEGFEALPPALDREALPMHQALRLLLSRLRGDAVPPPADEGAVELLGWLELHLDDAAELVITGVNEPFLPESVSADPFLPQTLRSQLGLADNRRRRARDLYLLSAILASRPGTLLVAGRRDASGNPLRPSRLLLADTPEAVARRVLSLLEGDAGDAKDAPHPDPAGAAGSGRPSSGPPAPAFFTLPPEPVISAPGGPPDRIAVTTFKGLLADPYRYALERVLDLDRITDEARELEPMAFGTLAHAVVERWARLPGADRMPEAEIFKALSSALDTHFDDRFGARPLPALRLQREQLRARLRGYATVQADRNREGWQIMAVEAAPAGEGVPFHVDGEPILLRGRIDRVDRHPGTGTWQLLDLKSSEKAQDPDAVHRRGRGSARRWVDLQLPLYRLLAPGLRDERTGEPLLPPGAPVETGYILLPGSEACIALADWTGSELEEAEETAAEVVRMLRANRFAWNPASTSIGGDDPLGPLVGRGVLQDDDEDTPGDGDSTGDFDD